MKHSISPSHAVDMIPEGARVMIGGFMGVGTPERLIDALVASGTGSLTIIANDTALPGKGIGKLITAGSVRKVITSHIGLNPETQRLMNAGKLEVDLVPQGTLVECIRSAGVGLGAVVTKTGLGTAVAEGKQVLELEGQLYLVELPIYADFALIAARQADYVGNLEYALTAQNFNPIMALAAETVIAEPDHIVPVGMIPPDAVRTPAALVDHLIERAK
ncbi:3-oxoacid CoA-transferase subunit A [Tateyamaria sp. SN6-1]|uniref:3-oxoacid CoA-transferase subunit A n=1 Tax=Tateyamaria sp. SN6-1 TaxID=3092148 RepID=UPI0039F59ACE